MRFFFSLSITSSKVIVSIKCIVFPFKKQNQVFIFWPQMILRAPALKWFGFFFFPVFLYSCDLVNCRWGANSEIIQLSSLLRNLAPWNCRMSSLITGSQVSRSATFVSFVCWDKEERFACSFLMVRGEREDRKTWKWPKDESLISKTRV